MGLYTGSASYVRYRLIDDPPERVKEFALEKLKEFSFREIETGTLNEKSPGGCLPKHGLDVFRRPAFCQGTLHRLFASHRRAPCAGPCHEGGHAAGRDQIKKKFGP